jgi:integral membrane protein
MIDGSVGQTLADPLRRLRILGWIEGCTLIALIFAALYLKRVLGLSSATPILGAVHGLFFFLYFATLVEAVAYGHWSRREAIRCVLATLVPLGTFFNDRMLARKIATEGA